MPKTKTKGSVAFNAVLCDEVRKEDNGKLIVIGVYSGDILLEELPATLALAVYGNFSLPAGQTTIDMRFRFDGEPGSAVEVIAEGPSENVIGIHTPRLPVPCAREGQLIFEVKFNNRGDWQEIVTKRVVLRETFAREAASGSN